MYIKDYYELMEFKTWALAYYPKVFQYWYYPALNISQSEFEAFKEKRGKEYYKIAQDQWIKITNGTLDRTVAKENIREMYPNWPEEGIEDEVQCYYDDYMKTEEEYIEDTEYLVMITPLKTDTKLKWICPVDCVRRYLRHNCGVIDRWYHKIFWKGKKVYCL